MLKRKDYCIYKTLFIHLMVTTKEKSKLKHVTFKKEEREGKNISQNTI